MEIIIGTLIKQGYTEEKAGELLRKFVEEQAQLDRIRDYFCDIIWLNVPANSIYTYFNIIVI